MHKLRLGHIPLPDSSRVMVAAKLRDGVSIGAILDSVRDSVEKLGRTELMSCQDIHDIRHQYNIEDIKLHSNDRGSDSLWVENIQNGSESENPVLLFKQQFCFMCSNILPERHADEVWQTGSVHG